MMENKVHQPYEMWLYEKDGLTTEQRTMLYQHLRECPRCRQIQLGWEEVIHRIRSSGMVKPVAGFSQRWRASIDARRSVQIRRQTWSIFILLTAAAFISLLILALQVGAGTTFSLFLSQMKIAARFLVDIFILFQAIINFLKAFPSSIMIPSLILSLYIFTYLTLLWVKTFNRVSKHEVYSK